MRFLHKMLVGLTLLLSAGCTGLIGPREKTTNRLCLPVRAWWTKSSTAMSDLARAREFAVNTVIIQHDNHGVEWNEVIDGLAVYDFSGRHRRSGDTRRRVRALRDHYRAITAETHKQGIQSYVMCPEIDLPGGFEQPSYHDPELWNLVRSRLQEVFRALPDLSGFMLYLCEGQTEVFELPGAETSPANRARKLIDTVWEACRAENRKLLVTTFIHHPEKLEAIARALRTFPPHRDFAVVQYCCPNDWGLYAVVNPALGRVGPHPEILAFDYAAENWGQGAHPFVHVDFMARRLRDARRRSARIAGLAGYVAWYARSALGTLNEANVYAASVLAQDPERDGREILHEWCTKRFGKRGAKIAAECLARTHAAIFKTQHVFGYWLDTVNKSGLPSLAELEEYFIGDHFGEALGKWDPAYLPTWRKIQSPDDRFLSAMLEEKEEAIGLSRQSLEEIRAARELFRPADFRTLERAFAFQELWARIWREQVRAFFLRQIATRRGWTPDRRKALARVLETMSSEADELEARFGKDVFPRGPDRARRFIRDLRRCAKDSGSDEAPGNERSPPEKHIHHARGKGPGRPQCWLSVRAIASNSGPRFLAWNRPCATALEQCSWVPTAPEQWHNSARCVWAV